MVRFLLKNGFAPFATFAILLVAVGCEPVKPIRSYKVPKPELVYEANHLDPGTPTDPSGNPLPLDDRMLAALIPHGQHAWFVKLSGPKEAVAPQAEAFQAFVKSIQFTEDKDREPTWTAPENWVRTNGPPPRWATLTIPESQPPLEVTISSLPMESRDLAAYSLLNLNRWRNQLGLRPIPQQQLIKSTTTLNLAGGPALYVDMEGKLQDTGMGGRMAMGGHPPIAGGSSSKTASKAPPVASQSDAGQAEGIKYELPSGWRGANKDAFSQVALEAGSGEDQIRVTFSALAAAAADLVPNINRWRSQAGLEPVSPEALMADVAKMEIGGKPGHYVELLGPEEAIFGAIVVHQDQAWFLKLRGSKTAAEAEQDNFRKLLQSIRFE